MKFGIEFEMTIYYNNYDQFEAIMGIFERCTNVTDDGSINAPRKPGYKYQETTELRAGVFTSKENAMRTVKEMFVDAPLKKNLNITFNESGGDIRIDFNSSTGMHIHYSDKMTEYDNKQYRNGSGTCELFAFGNENILTAIYNHIRRNCKYPSIKADFSRRYTNERGDIYQCRYKTINISNSNEHGTIEFRLFNLHGITTDQVIDAIEHQLDLVIEGVKFGYERLQRSRWSWIGKMEDIMARRIEGGQFEQDIRLPEGAVVETDKINGDKIEEEEMIYV